MEFHIVLRNKIEEIVRMTEFVDEISRELNLSVEDSFNIRLAIEEAVTNVIMYAYPQTVEGDILLSAREEGDVIVFQLVDSGNEFDPTLQPDADVTSSLEDREIGGLGIFLIRQLMQSVSYSRIDGKNVLTMIKQLS